MPRILILQSSNLQIVEALRRAGHAIASAYIDDDNSDVLDEMCRAFDGRAADVIIADLTEATDFLPLRHVQYILRETWGEEMRIPCVALLSPYHLGLPDLPAFVEDFLLPPHDPSEAVVRTTLQLFKSRQARDTDRLTFADLTLDLASGKAFDTHGEEMILTRREFELLRFLCTHRGKFFDRDRILALVWGIEFAGGDRTVDIHVCRLRSKLPPHAASLLETRRGLGYGFKIAS
jgi:DNA-binding winged helix-turn-helix (wHTH) protein